MTTTVADKMPRINLVGSFHSLKLSQATSYLSSKKTPFTFTKEYVLLHEILLTFVPLISFGDKYSAFKVAVVDNRKVDDVVVRSYVGNTNISCNASMSLDYCVSIDDLQDLELAFVCPQPTLKAGKVWAVINVHLVLKQFDFPVQSYVKPTFSIFQIPHSGLEDNDTDPRHFNGLIQEADLDAMKQIKSDGDIADSSKPHVKTMAKSALAGTAFAGSKSARPLMGKMTIVQDAEEKSISSGYAPEDDGEEEDVPRHIQRLQESALRAQREAAGLDPFTKAEDGRTSPVGSIQSYKELKSSMKKPAHHRSMSGTTINSNGNNVNIDGILNDLHTNMDNLRHLNETIFSDSESSSTKKARFKDVKSSISGDQGDEDISHLD